MFAALIWGGQPRDTELQAYNTAHHLAIKAQQLWGMPVEHRPKIIWNYDDDWPVSGWADCKAWSITLNHRVAMKHTQAMMEKVLPHEYGHLVYCYLNNGTVGQEEHGIEWQFIVTNLGGDPNFR